jgi:hypothetical protein
MSGDLEGKIIDKKWFVSVRDRPRSDRYSLDFASREANADRRSIVPNLAHSRLDRSG